MKTTKTIAALCAIGMVVSTMAMPVQAKTASKTETEIITMDTPTTTTKAKSKSKTTTKKSSSKATDEYKDWGKDLKVTVHNPEELTQAYLYANMMCAKSLTITFAKDYKVAQDNCGMEFFYQKSVITYGMLLTTSLCDGNEKSDEKNRTVTAKNFGDHDVMPYFVYAYRTGDTAVVPKEHKDLYDRLSKGVNSCVSGTDSITDVADNICKWLDSNAIPQSKASYRGKLKNSVMRYDTNNKMLLNCEGYSYIFRTMMRMAGYTAYHVHGLSPRGIRHAWNAIKVGDEYRYYDAGWSMTNMTYKEMTKAGYKPEAQYRHSYEDGGADASTEKPTQKQVEALFIDWH